MAYLHFWNSSWPHPSWAVAERRRWGRRRRERASVSVATLLTGLANVILLLPAMLSYFVVKADRDSKLTSVVLPG